MHVANPHGSRLFIRNRLESGGRAVPDCPENHFFKIAFAIHFRILFSLISLRILEIQLKKNWPRALFFFRKNKLEIIPPVNRKF